MRKHLFLYLALACFVGLIAIFITDGYLGIYDTVYATAGEDEQEIEPDFWLKDDTAWLPAANWGEPVLFRYQINNRRFSSYATHIQVSVWKANAKVMDLLAEDKVVKPFDEVTVEWTLDSEELESLGFSARQYTVKIERDGAELKIIVDYYILDYPLKSSIIR
jgi:hypothetical protein